MSFGSPEWLWALAALPVVALLLLLVERARRARWRRLARPRTAERISEAEPPPVLTRSALILLACALVVLALARPRWGETEEPLTMRGLDLVVALDLSSSMLAEDVAPSRLTVARSVATELARRLPSDRVGLVGFAGRALSLCPMTLDRAALELYLASADPSVLAAQGTDLGAAIDAAREMFRRHGRARRVLVLLSDGEDQESGFDDALARARDDGITIYAVGVGTSSGAPIPVRSEDGTVRGYREAAGGTPLTTRLVEDPLRRAAEATGGAYARAAGVGLGLDQLVRSIERLDRQELTDVMPARKAERYRWPLLGAFVLAGFEAALVTRRRKRRR